MHIQCYSTPRNNNKDSLKPIFKLHSGILSLFNNNLNSKTLSNCFIGSMSFITLNFKGISTHLIKSVISLLTPSDIKAKESYSKIKNLKKKYSSLKPSYPNYKPFLNLWIQITRYRKGKPSKILKISAHKLKPKS